MVNKRLIKTIGWGFNVFAIFLLVWSSLNYKFLEDSVNMFVQVGGLIALVAIVIALEGAPVFIGGGVSVAALLAMGADPLTVLVLLLVSAVIGNIVYYYLGYFSGRKILKYFDKEDVARYERSFKKYGHIVMIFMAVSPVPYLPTLAGAFKMSPSYMFTIVLGVRLIRHIVVFSFWYILLV